MKRFLTIIYFMNNYIEKTYIIVYNLDENLLGGHFK